MGAYGARRDSRREISGNGGGMRMYIVSGALDPAVAAPSAAATAEAEPIFRCPGRNSGFTKRRKCVRDSDGSLGNLDSSNLRSIH